MKKKKSMFSIFGYIMIVWACIIFTASSKRGEVCPSYFSSDLVSSYPEEETDIQFADEDLEDIYDIIFQPAFLVLNLEEGQDLILNSYRNPELQNDVLAFFEDYIGSYDIAKIILSNASDFDISPAFAVSLCAEESSYNPRALNRNRNETIDRGLFQLNSSSFPDLTVEEFYTPEINARHGLSHLRWCLNTAGTEVAALAMYNAGSNRVRSAGTPKSTLDYVSRILSRQRKIEKLFMAEYARIVEERNIVIEIVETIAHVAPFRMSLLSPLGR